VAAQLVVQVLAALPGPQPMSAAARCIQEHSGADRVSITAIDGDRYQVVAHAGSDLLPVGARFALDTSTHFLLASEGDDYECVDFTSDTTFRRPLDRLVVSSGFRSGLSLPMTLDDRVVGALSLSSSEYSWDPGNYQRIELEATAALLASHLTGDGWTGPLSVLVAHRDALVSAGLREVMSSQVAAETTVVGDVEHLAVTILTSRPDVVIMGESFDQRGDVAAALKDANMHVPIVFLAVRDAPSARAMAGHLGAAAFVSHEVAHSHLSNVVVSLARREPIDPAHLPTAPGPVSHTHLTQREQELLRGLACGQALRDIAGHLGLSETTLKGYARNLYGKLDAHSRGQAVYIARERGLLN
jgi:DNA-binding NarL/FixJ family response regulator